eukprot:5367728-Pyramimonas_sp.AAC.1
MARARAAALRLQADDLEGEGGGRGQPESLGNDGGAGLREYLVKQCRAGIFSAVDVCTIAHRACKGGRGGVGDLALDPSRSAHAADH